MIYFGVGGGEDGRNNYRVQGKGIEVLLLDISRRKIVFF